jgi:hypothetical protein
MEYREPLNVIINVPNIEYFNLHTFLTTLLCYLDGDDKSDQYMLVINNISYTCIC